MLRLQIIHNFTLEKRETVQKLTYCGNKLSQEAPVSSQTICVCDELDLTNLKSGGKNNVDDKKHCAYTEVWRHKCFVLFRQPFGVNSAWIRPSTLCTPLLLNNRVSSADASTFPLAQDKKFASRTMQKQNWRHPWCMRLSKASFAAFASCLRVNWCQLNNLVSLFALLV